MIEGVDKSPYGELDAGADRDKHDKPCGARIDYFDCAGIRCVTWCARANCDGKHHGPTPEAQAPNEFAGTRSKR